MDTHRIAENLRLPVERRLGDELAAAPIRALLPRPHRTPVSQTAALAYQGPVRPLATFTECFAIMQSRALPHGLNLDEVQIHIAPGPAANAYAVDAPQGGPPVVAITGPVLELLAPTELAFVIGHELGHHVLGSPDEWAIEAQLDVLPQNHPVRLALCSHRRARELGCDRVGMLLCGNGDAATAALRKVVASTSRLDRPQARYEDWAFFDAELDRVAPWTFSHPFGCLRERALRAYAEVASLRAANTRAEAWLDKMELDVRKADRELVRSFWSAVYSLASRLGPIPQPLRRFLSNRAGRVSDSPHDWLVTLASPGRRTRIFELLTSIATARRDARALSRASQTGVALGLPAGWVSDRANQLWSLTCQHPRRPASPGRPAVTSSIRAAACLPEPR